MRAWLWMLFFLVCNIIGVHVFSAAWTLPFEDAMWPRLLSIPMIALTALGAVRLMSVWNDRDD
jgi:hypothetical protein